MQPTEIVSVMAAIIYSQQSAKSQETIDQVQHAAVAEAWQLWHLTLEHWTDFGARSFHDPTLPDDGDTG